MRIRSKFYYNFTDRGLRIPVAIYAAVLKAVFGAAGFSRPRDVIRRCQAGAWISRFGMGVSSRHSAKKRRKKLQKNCIFSGKIMWRALFVSICGHCRAENRTIWCLQLPGTWKDGRRGPGRDFALKRFHLAATTRRRKCVDAARYDGETSSGSRAWPAGFRSMAE